MALKRSGSFWKPALGFLAGICLSLVVGGVLLASSAPEAASEKPQARSSTHAMPVSQDGSDDACDCGG